MYAEFELYNIQTEKQTCNDIDFISILVFMQNNYQAKLNYMMTYN